jgi:serine/threonine protein kinase
MAQNTAEHVCNLLGRSHLLAPDLIRDLYRRWRGEAGGAGDGDAFCQWLVAHEFLTEYQAGLVLRGRVDHFFFGPYKMLERVGKGRMAGVYKAVHTLGQLVAIKVLPPSKAKDPQLLARFRREAQLAMKLKHPNVVRTFQSAVTGGLHYIVMEYLDGESLEDVLRRRGQLPPAEAVRLVHQALLGLQHIHEQGMIHRDLKPGNLMLVGGTAASTQRATLKVMDIGLGKALFEEGAPAPAGKGFELTNEGSLLGTPDYMAPEQARSAQTADIRADIYSLGCVLYQALAGQVPFVANNLVELLMRHATEAPRPLRQLNPAVPEGLQQIVGWMMVKDPAQRYPTPDRAAQALQVFLAAATEEPAKPEAKMNAYLQWLDSQSGDTDVPLAVPVAEPVVAARALADDAIDVELVAPAAKKAAPAAKSERDDSDAAPKKSRRPRREDEDEEDDEPKAPAKKKRPARADTDDKDDEPEAPRKLSRRDLVMLGVGGAVIFGVALFGGLLYLLSRWLGRRADDAAPTAREPGPESTEGN